MYAFLGNLEAQELDLFAEEMTFICIQTEAILSADLENLLKTVNMFVFCGSCHDKIIMYHTALNICKK